MIGRRSSLPANQITALIWVALVAGATTVSLLITGFQFGVADDVFHIPYVLRLNELPQFAGDAFYQSLHRLPSGIWPLVRLVADEDSVRAVFLVCFTASRALAFAAMLWAFRELGLSRWHQCFVALIVAAASPWLLQASIIGGHGMFVDHFSHSEAAWGPLLASVVGLRRRSLQVSAVFAGVVFIANAFVGIWLAIAIVITVISDRGLRNDWRPLARAAGIYCIVCMPVVVWSRLSAGGTRTTADFSYVEYVRIYFPQHFLAEVVTARQWVDFSLVSCCGLLALWILPSARLWRRVFAAFLGIFGVGVFLPYILDSGFVFSLHLLRVSGVVQFFATIFSVAALVSVALESSEEQTSRLLAILGLTGVIWLAGLTSGLVVASLMLALVLAVRRKAMKARFIGKASANATVTALFTVGLITMSVLAMDIHSDGLGAAALLRWLFVLASASIVLWRSADVSRLAPMAWILIFCFWTIGSTGLVWKWRGESADVDAPLSRYRSGLFTWIRDSKIAGPVLIPTSDEYRDYLEEFQWVTRKAVWVDWKQGAAVMWEPGFHAQWMSRYRQTRQLHAPQEFAAYAMKNGIRYFVLPSAVGNCPVATRAVFDNPGFHVCGVTAQ